MPDKFVNWVRQSIINPSYSISINGSLAGFFKGKKGLRQGNPLSPYPSVIAMEILTKLMNKEVQVSKQLKFHPNYSKLQITHLSFADDLLMFSSANV